MNLRRNNNITFLSFLILTAPLLTQAAPGPPTPMPPEPPAVPGQVLSFAQLLRVGTVNTPSGNPLLGSFGSATGSDPLSDGSVEVLQDRQISVQVQGAAASATYNVAFCLFGFPVTLGCTGLGQLNTDKNGDATAAFTFPPPATSTDNWNGSFVLSRNIGGSTAEFISGFSFPPTPPATTNGVQLQLTGTIQTINNGNGSFALIGLGINIFTGDSTKFQGPGVHDLGDLSAGDGVQVTGFTQSNGTIFATTVKDTPADH